MLPKLPGAYSTYWWTALIVDDDLIPERDWIVEALQAEGVPAGSYGTYDLIQKALFQERIVRPWLGDERRSYPFTQPDGREYTYSIDDTPTHKHLLDTGIQLSVNGAYTSQDVDEMATGIRKVMGALG